MTHPLLTHIAAGCAMASLHTLQGAGGKITDWRGRPLVWRPPAGAVSNEELRAGWPGEVCAAGDPSLHAKALALLDWS